MVLARSQPSSHNLRRLFLGAAADLNTFWLRQFPEWNGDAQDAVLHFGVDVVVIGVFRQADFTVEAAAAFANNVLLFLVLFLLVLLGLDDQSAFVDANIDVVLREVGQVGF